MTLKKWVEEAVDPDVMNSFIAESFTMLGINTIRQLIDRVGIWSSGIIDGWGDAYIDADGRENSVDTDETSATFDTDKYKAFDDSKPHIIIEATSLTESDFAINNCLIKKIGARNGQWLLFCTTGTNAVRRAQIYKTLFFGTDGTNPRAASGFITSITALKTSEANDVGKRAYYFQVIGTDGNLETGTIETEATFSNTSTNNNFSSWSNVTSTSENATVGNIITTFQVPDDTDLNTVTANDGTTTSNEIGTSTTGDETNNPATAAIFSQTDTAFGNSDGWGEGRAFFLCVDSVSFANVTTGSVTGFTTSNTDFFTDNSMPLLTAVDDDLSVISMTIPSGTFGTTITTSIGIPLVEDWETGANIQYKFVNSGGDDSGWLNAMNTSPEISSFTAFSAEPDSLLVKLVPKSTAPSTGFPSINGFWVRAT